eukprot:TRINITY_DN1059_c0_g1_i1.p1 TRINITY_DN1059_c0_g1~~TRINITY_DN1059_c0_g1_i1.p1  ORF type:complete len:386 (+),score=55.04 TRINITY_DN1059_c0_g1_i1:442-1599(+)
MAKKKTDIEVYYVDHYGQNNFFRHRIMLYSWGTGINIGQFQIPFSFKLPDNLPGSYDERVPGIDDNEYKAVIAYKVKAESLASGLKLKHTQPLIIREPIKTMSSIMQQSMQVHAKTWCCIDQGLSSIKCYFDNSWYMPGDTAQVITEIDNSKCKLAVKKIDSDLVKYLKLTANSGHTKDIRRVVCRTQFPGLPAFTSSIGDQKRQTPIPLVSEIQNQPLQPSANGQFVNCQYTLKVTGVLEGCTCCNKDPNAEVPIQLVSRPLANFNQVQRPENWSPQVLPAITVNFNPNDMYQSAKSQNMNINVSVPSPQQMMSQMPQMNMNVNMNPVNPMLQPQAQVNMNMNMNEPLIGANMGMPQMNVQMNVSGNAQYQPPQQGNIQVNFQA